MSPDVESIDAAAFYECGLTFALSGPREAIARRRGRDNLPRARGAPLSSSHGPLRRIVISSGHDSSRDVEQNAWVAIGNKQESPSRSRRGAAPLFPILQRANRDTQQGGEPRLGEPDLFADPRHVRYFNDPAVVATLEFPQPVADLKTNVALTFTHRQVPHESLSAHGREWSRPHSSGTWSASR